jgi:hypothetical protein
MNESVNEGDENEDESKHGFLSILSVRIQTKITSLCCCFYKQTAIKFNGENTNKDGIINGFH